LEKRIKQVRNEISRYFLKTFNIELEDSPQILDEYLYLEYSNSNGDVKLRIPYDNGCRECFLDMDHDHRIFWVMSMVLKEIIF